MIAHLYLVRHGATEWTQSGRHTGSTDISLSPQGILQAKELKTTLSSFSFDHVWTSPLKRAQETCAYAGFSERAEVKPDLKEWDYGKYEGLTSLEIAAQHPGWNVFQQGAPGGESVTQVEQRVDRALHQLSLLEGNCLLFAHAHLLRVLTARWLELPASYGRLFYLDPASLSILGFEHHYPVIRKWNR